MPNEKWLIADHNGVVMTKDGPEFTDTYAQENLRTVYIDLDVDGKYVEFSVHKNSAVELRDYLNKHKVGV